jgi:hypothetical protein
MHERECPAWSVVFLERPFCRMEPILYIEAIHLGSRGSIKASIPDLTPWTHPTAPIYSVTDPPTILHPRARRRIV